MAERVAIGIDVGGTATKGALVGSDGSVLSRVERPTDPSAGTKGVVAVADELQESAAAGGHEIAGVGIGVAGFVDAASGTVTFSPNLTYEDPAVGEAVHARLRVPVILDNDANAAAWGEYIFGSARGTDHLAMLTLGTGVGSGFVTGGKLLRGASGAGAEFGHTVVEVDGPQCKCGLRGCLEQFASGQAIERMARAALVAEPESAILDFAGSAEEVTAENVAQAAKNYDQVATAVLRRAGRALGVGLSNVVNVFDPRVIVLGGSVAGAGEAFLGTARDTLNGMLAAQSRRPVRLDVSALGSDAGVIGSAALVFEVPGYA